MRSESDSPVPGCGQDRAALIIGHPGHELRIHHWLELARPLTFVLTDGSGRGQVSRLPSTARILREAGASAGPVFGRWTDAEAYGILMNGEVERVASLAREIAATLVNHKIRVVAADALEGYSPTHDLCRFITNAAVLVAARDSGERLRNYEFLLAGPPDLSLATNGDRDVRLQLDAAALMRKEQAAENYPELKHEVDAAVARFGREVFATEILRPISAERCSYGETPPYYETYGEKQVAQGHYDKVIRARENVLPLMDALWRALDLPL